MVKFSNLFSKVFTASPIDVVVLNIVKFFLTGTGEMVRYLPDKKSSAPSQTVASALIAPKICQGQPPTFGSHYSRFHLNRFTFGGVIAKRVKAVLFPREYYHARLFEPTNI